MIERLHLPFPPSENDIYANLRRVPSKRYKTWKRVADNELLAQRRAKNIKPVLGPYRLQIVLDCGKRIFKNGNRRVIDCGNFEKAVSDWLKHNELITDDSFCEGQSIEWGWVGEGMCSVTVLPTNRVALPSQYREAAE